MARRHRKLSKKASAFIARETRRQRHEGKPPRQSVAIAYSKARRHGYKIPRRKR